MITAKHSLWYSLSGGAWVAPTRENYTSPPESLPPPLNRWQSLVEVARLAPSVTVAIIDGREYGTCDGIGFRHRVFAADTDLYAEWNNPNEAASNHTSQVLLVRAYGQALESCCGHAMDSRWVQPMSLIHRLIVGHFDLCTFVSHHPVPLRSLDVEPYAPMLAEIGTQTSDTDTTSMAKCSTS